MRLPIGVGIATLSGFIALSYEIVWLRIYGFMTEAKPESFALLLSAYLAGLAFGSLLASQYVTGSERPSTRRYSRVSSSLDPLYLIGAFLTISSIAAFLLIPFIAYLVTNYSVSNTQSLLLFAMVAVSLGTVFPLLSHFAIAPGPRAGEHFSYLYAGNILGSTVGSLATGLWLLDVLKLNEFVAYLSIASLTIAIFLMTYERGGGARRRWLLGTYAVTAPIIFFSASPLYEGVYEKLQYQEDYYSGRRFAEIFEGRSGVITVSRSGTLYGGGSYDGQFNVSPIPSNDTNRVRRAYLIAGIHEKPSNILMVGLGSGSWLQVLANHPEVEQITVVEINRGFVEMMRTNEIVASAIEHPKVRIVIGDGRRFLRNSHHKWDLIIQNTIVYWRAHASNLLSREYLELTRNQLTPGGMLFYNTTASSAAQKTATDVFPHVLRYENMMICSDDAVIVDLDKINSLLDDWAIDGEKVLPPAMRAADLRLFDPKDWRGKINWESRESIIARTKDQPIITDDNMASEWWAGDTYP